MDTGEIGVGVIGTGFGVRTQIPVWSQTAGARVVAVCSHSSDRAAEVAQQFDIPHAVTSYDALASLPEVDLVSVVTTPPLHYPAVMAAIAAGKHILCEKPFALDAAQGREMLEAADARKLLHFVNHEFRQVPERKKLLQLVAEGYVGRINQVVMNDVSAFLQNAQGRIQDWLIDSDNGGGWLNASSSHCIDILGVLDEIVAVSAVFNTALTQANLKTGPKVASAEDSYAIIMRYRGGGHAAYVSSGAAVLPAHPMQLEVFGSEGTLSLQGQRLLGGRKGDGGLREIEVEAAELSPGESFGAQLMSMAFARWAREIVGSIKSGKQVRPSFEDALKTQKVLDAVRRSVREGRMVEVG